MLHSPSWEANWFAATQEIPRISRNPNVHYRTHKLPPTISILGQPNAVHIPTSQLLEIHPNIIHPSTPSSPQCCPSFLFPHQDPIHPPFPHPYAPHAHPICVTDTASLNKPMCNFNKTDDVVQGNSKARSCNHFCIGKAIVTKYESVYICLP